MTEDWPYQEWEIRFTAINLSNSFLMLFGQDEGGAWPLWYEIRHSSFDCFFWP